MHGQNASAHIYGFHFGSARFTLTIDSTGGKVIANDCIVDIQKMASEPCLALCDAMIDIQLRFFIGQFDMRTGLERI